MFLNCRVAAILATTRNTKKRATRRRPFPVSLGSENLVVRRRVIDGGSGVVDGVAGAVDGVAGGVQRGVGAGSGIVRRGVDVRIGVVLNRSLIGGIVVGVLLARGEAEREDRNGHSNFLHDRSTPFSRTP